MNVLAIKIAAGVLALAAAVFAWDRYTDSLIAQGDKAGYARAVAEYRDRELEALQAIRKEEGRRAAALEGVLNDTRKELEAAQAAAAGAASAGERLRAQLSAARGRLCPGAAAANRGASAQATANLLAELQRRLEEAENATVRFADEGRIAGRACEKAYDALTP